MNHDMACDVFEKSHEPWYGMHVFARRKHVGHGSSNAIVWTARSLVLGWTTGMLMKATQIIA